MTTLSPFKVACAQARAIAMATGKATSVTKVGNTPLVVTKVVKPSFTPMSLQGNTADDRAANNETEDDFVARSYRAEDDLDAQLNRDAKWYAGWYPEQHTARVASFGTAKRIARQYGTAKSPARIKRVSTPKVVTYTYDYEEKEEYTEINVVVVHYEVYYMTKVCYACPGDVDFVEPEFIPGLLWSQARDCSAEEALAE